MIDKFSSSWHLSLGSFTAAQLIGSGVAVSLSGEPAAVLGGLQLGPLPWAWAEGGPRMRDTSGLESHIQPF